MKISAKTKICMVIGNPIEHSLSPQIHNAGYEKLGIESDYVYVACNVEIQNIADFIKGVRAMQIRGVSCTIPHKIEVMKHLDEVDEVAEKIGAVNTIVNENGVLNGYNTDWLGVVIALEKVTSLKNKRVALIGAGGAARAVAYGVTQRGAKLTIYNRTIEKAKELINEFGGEAYSLDDIEGIKNMDIIFNATSVGLASNKNETPLPKELMTNKHIIFDAIYVPYETRLLREAKQQGATIIHGMEMLLQQAIAQFKLYTGHDAPEDVMRNVLLDNLITKEKKYAN
ncbi:MAG: shikimate dehydrogenase [Candidatus Pacebacteria bacterium CG_4_10_14_3_um_filter_34_15]|nr:MAG: shikimate dehydrogenase [Candidatus Pacebacteria bacterium CG11_big_fil_rev_8_21_14_0_20_34_55]PIX81760.1 MAG: shikimate dehydrogenase [Candidatus Pacebacteria bacterium CG_4_10_14_3_um_filter_34_15]PJC43471.1 MAG: shikimate dehydrogenase [Candidatus Pacebacteria bacterium CG_4_9_14_0_2_um_filter_34_50]